MAVETLEKASVREVDIKLKEKSLEETERKLKESQEALKESQKQGMAFMVCFWSTLLGEPSYGLHRENLRNGRQF